MSYIIKQKIKGEIYLYEATSYWDSKKNQARQKRIYLGKQDEVSGEAITPRKLPIVESALEYGHIYLLNQIINNIGLAKALSTSFDDQWVKIIISLAMFQISEQKSLYLYHHWSKKLEILKIPTLTSQRISELLSELANSETILTTFFTNWAKQQIIS